MNFIEEIRKRRDIKRQIGNANTRLEINKIICNFNDYFNHASTAEKERIRNKVRMIKENKSGLMVYAFLTGLGVMSSGVGVSNIFNGDMQYIAILICGLVVGAFGATKTRETTYNLSEGKKSILEYFKSVSQVDEDCAQMGDIEKHQLEGENINELKSQLIHDACDMYVRRFE